MYSSKCSDLHTIYNVPIFHSIMKMFKLKYFTLPYLFFKILISKEYS